MPFTLAHPAAMLPLRKTKLPFTALAIGAMAPDLNYILFPAAIDSHSLIGITLFCLPAGILAYYFFHILFKSPLLELLPDKHASFISQSINPVKLWDLHQSSLALLGILLGALSHIFWDSFTHPDGFFVATIPFLHTVIYESEFLHLELCRLLQHISTVAGIGLLYIYYRKAFLSHRSPEPINHLFSAAVRWLIICLIGIISFLYMLNNQGINFFFVRSEAQLHEFIYSAINDYIISLLCLLTVYSCNWHLLSRILISAQPQHMNGENEIPSSQKVGVSSAH